MNYLEEKKAIDFYQIPGGPRFYDYSISSGDILLKELFSIEFLPLRPEKLLLLSVSLDLFGKEKSCGNCMSLAGSAVPSMIY